MKSYALNYNKRSYIGRAFIKQSQEIQVQVARSCLINSLESF